jgi:uncharacterized repeat protein (TIGR01451 family)
MPITTPIRRFVKQFYPIFTKFPRPARVYARVRIASALVVAAMLLLLPFAAVDLQGIIRRLGVDRLLAQAPSLVATKSDTLITDDGDGIADSGETIRYTVIISNVSAHDANNVAFTDTIDANTTLNGTFKTTPIARNDSYAALGNLGITVPAGSGLLTNDGDPDGQSVAVVSASGSTVAGGDFSVSADGGFSYRPPPGYEGADSFNYTIVDDDGNLDPAIVSISVSETIWFIDNSAASVGDGRLSSPYNSLAAYNAAAADDPGDAIFIYETGSGQYNGGIVLKNGQLLIGQGATASIGTIAGITSPLHSNPLPSTGGSRPTIANSGGNGISLAQDNLLQGFNLANVSGTAIAGTSVGSLLASEMTISSANAGIDVDGGTLVVMLDSLSSSGTGPGIDLTNVDGSFTVSGGSASTSNATAVTLSGNPSLAHKRRRDERHTAKRHLWQPDRQWDCHPGQRGGRGSEDYE